MAEETGRLGPCARTNACRIGAFAVALAIAPLAALGAEPVTPDLSDEERAWLAAHPVVRLAPDPDFAPIDFPDEQGEPAGYANEILSRAAEKLGIRLETVRAVSWTEALEKARRREVDLLAAAMPTEERGEYLRFTEPIIELPLVIVARGGRRGLTLEDLAGKKVAIQGEHAGAQMLARDYPELRLERVDGVIAGLAEVAFGESDAYIGPLATASYHIQDSGIANLHVAGKTGLTYDLSIAGRSDWPLLVSSLDKAIATIEPEVRQELVARWVGPAVEPRLSNELLRVLGAVVITLAALLAGALVWRSTLRRMVVRQTCAMKRGQALLEDILASIPSAIFWKDNHSVYEGCNPEFARQKGFKSPSEIAGKTDAQLIGQGDRSEHYCKTDQLVLESGVRWSAEESGCGLEAGKGAFLVSKAPRLDAAGEVVGIVGVITDLGELRKAERAGLDNERRYRALFESAGEAILLLREGAIVDCNPMAVQIFGRPRQVLIGRHPHELSPEWQVDGVSSATAVDERNVSAMAAPQQFEWLFRRSDGTVFDTEVRLSRLELGDERLLLAMVRDVSARKRAEKERARLETQLRQAQKMEAIGKLAGGVAHDFNNILTALMSGLEVAQRGLEKQGVRDCPPTDALIESMQQAERAATLTRQLLAFSRQQVTQPRVLDLNGALSGLEKMLRRLTPESIALELRPAPEPRRVRADPGQIEQVIVNLVVNARDAMPQGGSLRLEIGGVRLDEKEAAALQGARPGPYVLLSVTDTGCGMDRATQERIFEPFFTTKPIGKGTGLGLATVYGIVQQSGGALRVESEPGKGTSFRIYFPEAGEEACEAEAADTQPVVGGNETVLVCEDDEAVRRRIAGMLREVGYQVLAAGGGSEAIDLADDHPGEIHLLLTDVIMPEMDGRTLSKELRLDIPGLRTLFISGHAAEVLAPHGVLGAGIELLEKPFKRDELLRRVRKLLDTPRRRDWE